MIRRWRRPKVPDVSNMWTKIDTLLGCVHGIDRSSGIGRAMYNKRIDPADYRKGLKK